MKEVRVGALASTADAATQLMELAEAEQVGAVDDKGVHRRHVDARFDDRGTDEHVVVALGEVDHHLLESCLVHLPVRYRDRCLGHELTQSRRSPLDVLHAVVYEKDLTLPEELTADGLCDRTIVLLADVGQYRLTGGWWGVDHRQVADPR